MNSRNRWLHLQWLTYMNSLVKWISMLHEFMEQMTLSTVFYPHWLRLTYLNCWVTWIHRLNEYTEQMTSSKEFYPEIPLCLFCTCFVVLFLKDGKHNSLSLPILDPTREITSFVKSSLISCIFRSISATYLAAEGNSWTKSLFRMWSTVSIMFFRASFNCRALYLNSDSLLAFSILSCNDLVAGDRNLYESFNRLIYWKFRSGVLYWEDSFCFLGVWKLISLPNIMSHSKSFKSFILPWVSFVPCFVTVISFDVSCV